MRPPPPPPPPPPAPPPLSGGFARTYTLSGSDGTSSGGSLDGVFSVTEARCRPYEDGSSSCDSGSDTTCGAAPVFQRGGADGQVLLRSVQESTDRQGYHTVRYYWRVTDSSALTNCGNGLHNSFASATGGEHPDDDMDRGWVEAEPRNYRDGGWKEAHRNGALQLVAGGVPEAPPPPP